MSDHTQLKHDTEGKCSEQPKGTSGRKPSELSEPPCSAFVSIDVEDWAYMTRCTAALEWLGKQGFCWRGADNFDRLWQVGDETEWLYAMHAHTYKTDLPGVVLKCRKQFSSNEKDSHAK